MNPLTAARPEKAIKNKIVKGDADESAKKEDMDPADKSENPNEAAEDDDAHGHNHTEKKNMDGLEETEPMRDDVCPEMTRVDREM